jgi:hypothetical protein
VDPVPDPLLLRKSGIAENRTRSSVFLKLKKEISQQWSIRRPPFGRRKRVQEREKERK